MSKGLAEAIGTVAQENWKPYGEAHESEIRECAEVEFVPWERFEQKETKPLRYVAIRIRKRQGELFNDGSHVKHFAIVSNIWDWSAARLIQWHRQKAGTVEIVNDVVKNELAGGVLPCGRFGANAAWYHLAVISYNVMTGLKRLAMKTRNVTCSSEKTSLPVFFDSGQSGPSRPQAVAEIEDGTRPSD
jgi:hypothetical protein